MRPGRAAEQGALLLGGLASLTLAGGLLGILIAAVWWGWSRLNLDLLTRPPEDGMTAGGILPAVAGTLILIGLMLVVVVPVGTLAGIYLHEYAPARSRVTRAMLFALEGLAGVPPVIVGLFGFAFFVQYVGGRIDRWLFGGEVTYRTPSLLWAALTLALLTLPTMVLTALQALAAVPRGLRDAGLAAGASHWQTLRDLVLPRAWAGILSGAILAISRGASEVAPVMFTGVAYFLPYLPSRLNDQFMELGYHVFVLATQSPDVRQTRPLLYASVVVLLSMTFLLHALAMALRRRDGTGVGRDVAAPPPVAAGPLPAGGATVVQEAGPVRRGPRPVVGGQPPRVKMDVAGVQLQVGDRVLLRGVTLPIHEHRITAVIGPAGSGKAALLRVMSRMAEEWEGARLEGRVLLDGADIRTLPAELVRRRVALIERPVVFPRSIYENVAYAPRLQGVRRKADLDARVEASLRAAGLWREVRDQLHRPATDLDPWQRVRLVLARALAAGPEVLLVDTSVIVMDPLALSTLEELLDALKASHTLVIVTHDLGQAARLSEYTAFLEKGELVEFGPTEDVFVHPQKERTRAYLMRPYHYGTAP